MELEKCCFYLVNGLNVVLFDVCRRGKVYIGYTDVKKSQKRVIKSSEINSIEGIYVEKTLVLISTPRGRRVK